MTGSTNSDNASNRPRIVCTKCQYVGEPKSAVNEKCGVCPRCGYLAHLIDAWPGSVTVWALAPLDWTPVQRGKPLDERFEAVRGAVRSVLKKDPIIAAAVQWAQERDEEERLGIGIGDGHRFAYDYERELYDAVKAAGLLEAGANE